MRPHDVFRRTTLENSSRPIRLGYHQPTALPRWATTGRKGIARDNRPGRVSLSNNLQSMRSSLVQSLARICLVEAWSWRWMSGRQLSKWVSLPRQSRDRARSHSTTSPHPQFPPILLSSIRRALHILTMVADALISPSLTTSASSRRPVSYLFLNSSLSYHLLLTRPFPSSLVGRDKLLRTLEKNKEMAIRGFEERMATMYWILTWAGNLANQKFECIVRCSGHTLYSERQMSAKGDV